MDARTKLKKPSRLVRTMSIELEDTSSVVANTSEAAAASIARCHDEALLRLIRERLPCEPGITVEGLAGRLHGFDGGKGCTEWVLDGQLIARFFPVKITTSPVGLYITQRYEVIR